MSGTDDPYGAAPDTRTLFRWARQPKRLVFLKCNRHGTDLLAPVAADEAVSEELIAAITSFLMKWST